MEACAVSVHRLPTTRPVALPEPEAVDQLDPEALVDLLTRLGALAERARARLVMTASAVKPTITASGSLLTAEEVAARLHVSKDYVYRHAKRWPFTRPVGRKLLFVETGLTHWVEARRARG